MGERIFRHLVRPSRGLRAATFVLATLAIALVPWHAALAHTPSDHPAVAVVDGQTDHHADPAALGNAAALDHDPPGRADDDCQHQDATPCHSSSAPAVSGSAQSGESLLPARKSRVLNAGVDGPSDAGGDKLFKPPKTRA